MSKKVTKSKIENGSMKKRKLGEETKNEECKRPYNFHGLFDYATKTEGSPGTTNYNDCKLLKDGEEFKAGACIDYIQIQVELHYYSNTPVDMDNDIGEDLHII